MSRLHRGGSSHAQRIKIGVNLCSKFTLDILDLAPNMSDGRNCDIGFEGQGQLFDRLPNRVRRLNLGRSARRERRTPYACTMSWYLFSRIRNSSCAISLTNDRMNSRSGRSAENTHTEGLKSLQGGHAQHEILFGHV